MAAIRDLTTPPKSNEESSSENSCACEGEQLFEQEIEEDEEELQHEHEGKCAYEILIEKWFQVSTRLDKFRFFVFI